MFEVSACEDALVLIKTGKLLEHLVELWVVLGGEDLLSSLKGTGIGTLISLEEVNIVFLAQCAWLIFGDFI